MVAGGTVAIVDGYSVGSYLPPAFAGLGVGAVHVQSSAELHPALQPPDLGAYLDNVVCPGPEAIDDAIAALAPYRPLAVLPGSEPGVPLADALGERLGLPGNGTLLSTARRDKYRMIETLRAAGVRCARQAVAATPEEAVAWAEREGGYPVVVKPRSSASTDHVAICADADEVARAARAILGTADLFRTPNTTVLVQTYLAGPEYIVDTVSADGERYVCAVLEYLKTTESGRRLYDRDVVLDPGQAPVPELVAYVDTVLAALGIRHGPAHAEVILTADGPALVEIGARLDGGMHPDFYDRCVEVDQADATALAYARPDEFRRRLAGRVYTRRTTGVVHHVRTAHDGIVRGVNRSVLDEIRALPSVFEVLVRYRPGDRITPTVDLRTSSLRVYLVGDDWARLTADHKTIGELRDLVYDVEPA